MTKDSDPVKIFLRKHRFHKKHEITYDDVINIIEYVANVHKNKKFGFMTEDDIASQVRLICLQQLKFYDKTKAIGIDTKKNLEKWLNKIIKNRLKNFYRDNCLSVNKDHSDSRRKLAKSANSHPDKNISFDKNSIVPARAEDEAQYTELQGYVFSRLNVELQEIYKSCLGQEAVTSYYKNKLEERMLEIIQEWNQDE